MSANAAAPAATNQSSFLGTLFGGPKKNNAPVNATAPAAPAMGGRRRGSRSKKSKSRSKKTKKSRSKKSRSRKNRK